MIHKIKVDGKASEVIDELVKQYPHRFGKIIDGEGWIWYNYNDEFGFEYQNSVYLKTTKDNKHILIYLNKKEFPKFVCNMWEYWEDDVVNLVVSYIDTIIPNGWEVV